MPYDSDDDVMNPPPSPFFLPLFTFRAWMHDDDVGDSTPSINRQRLRFSPLCTIESVISANLHEKKYSQSCTIDFHRIRRKNDMKMSQASRSQHELIISKFDKTQPHIPSLRLIPPR